MKVSVILMAAVFAIAPAFADEAVHESKTTVEHSDNAMTGSHTKTVKHHHKNKKMNEHGTESTVTEKTKTDKNGDVKKEVKAEEKTTH